MCFERPCFGYHILWQRRSLRPNNMALNRSTCAYQSTSLLQHCLIAKPLKAEGMFHKRAGQPSWKTCHQMIWSVSNVGTNLAPTANVWHLPIAYNTHVIGPLLGETRQVVAQLCWQCLHWGRFHERHKMILKCPFIWRD